MWEGQFYISILKNYPSGSFHNLFQRNGKTPGFSFPTLFDPCTVVRTNFLSTTPLYTGAQHIVLCLELQSSLETSVKRKKKRLKKKICFIIQAGHSPHGFNFNEILLYAQWAECFPENVQDLLPFFHSFCKVDKHLEFNMPLMDSSLCCK